jgi:hypothetical protein
MPYQLQVQREQVHRLATLEDLVKKLSAKDQKKEQEENDAPILLGNQRLMIGAGPGVNGAMPPMQMPMQTGFY